METWYKTTQKTDPSVRKGTFAGEPAMIVTSNRNNAPHSVYEIARPGGQILGVVTRMTASDPTARPTVEKILASCKFVK